MYVDRIDVVSKIIHLGGAKKKGRTYPAWNRVLPYASDGLDQQIYRKRAEDNFVAVVERIYPDHRTRSQNKRNVITMRRKRGTRTTRTMRTRGGERSAHRTSISIPGKSMRGTMMPRGRNSIQLLHL